MANQTDDADAEQSTGQAGATGQGMIARARAGGALPDPHRTGNGWVVALVNEHLVQSVLFGPFESETSAMAYAAACADRQAGDETTGPIRYEVTAVHRAIDPDNLSTDVGVFAQGD